MNEASNKLNEEIKKEEQDDESTDSADDDTTSDSDTDEELKKISRNQAIMREEDYGLNETLKF